MMERVRRFLGSPGFVAALAGLLVVSLVLNVVGLASAGSQEDADRLAAVERDVAEVRDSQLQVLEEVFRFQQDLEDLAPSLSGELEQAAADLAAFRTAVLEFDVPISERIPIATEIPIRRTVDVPIDTSVPIDETIDTTITVAGPFGIDIPLDVTVPVQLDLPVQLTVPLTIDEVVPISTEIPVDVTVPIRIGVADTELVRLVDGLQTLVSALQQVLAALR